MSKNKNVPPYYKISLFADMVGLPQSKVRFYERSGLLPERRLQNGYRYFLPEDAFRMNEFRVLRSYGFSVEDAIRLLEENQSGETFTQSLTTQREALLREQDRLQKRMENIDRTLALIKASERLSRDDGALLGDIEQGERFSVVDRQDIVYVRASHGRDFSISERNSQAFAEYVSLMPVTRYMRIIRRACFEDGAQVDPDYICGMPIGEHHRIRRSAPAHQELLKLGRCLRYIRLETRQSSVGKETFDPVWAYMRDHGYRLRGDILLVPTFLNLDGQGLDVEELYIPII